jgi:hypothetical protein
MSAFSAPDGPVSSQRNHPGEKDNDDDADHGRWDELSLTRSTGVCRGSVWLWSRCAGQVLIAFWSATVSSHER